MDYSLIRQLLAEADAANAPDAIDAGEWEHCEFTTPTGWKVVIYYDGGDLDYIDHFVSPDGERLDLWSDEIDPRLDDRGEDQCFATLQNWRQNGDGVRLLAYLPPA